MAEHEKDLLMLWCISFWPFGGLHSLLAFFLYKKLSESPLDSLKPNSCSTFLNLTPCQVWDWRLKHRTPQTPASCMLKKGLVEGTQNDWHCCSLLWCWAALFFRFRRSILPMCLLIAYIPGEILEYCQDLCVYSIQGVNTFNPSEVQEPWKKIEFIAELCS